MSDTFYQHEHGRWMCINEGDAYDTMKQHPGETIYLYDRDPDGKTVNIRQYWASTMPDTNKITSIRNGKIRTKA